MRLTFRWFGDDDPVTLQAIRQIPGVTGIVSAIYGIPVGEVWPLEKIRNLKQVVERHGLTLNVIESVPVHEDIKLGNRTRDKWIANYQETLRHLAQEGITTVCYNFMPVFDWTRTQLDYERPDGSKALIYEDEMLQYMDPVEGELSLPGWDTSYEKDKLRELINAYREMTEEDLWENLKYFLVKVMETADEVGINMAIHPDDPPWSVFGIPRIITNRTNLERLLSLVDSPRNGLTFCTGSLGADPNNQLEDMIRLFGAQRRIHFMHVRNVKHTGHRSFHETSHWSRDGSINMRGIIQALHDVGFEGSLRPDHGRMIWGETGRPGYGLFDRALGAVYLNGIWEGLGK